MWGQCFSTSRQIPENTRVYSWNTYPARLSVRCQIDSACIFMYGSTSCIADHNFFAPLFQLLPITSFVAPPLSKSHVVVKEPPGLVSGTETSLYDYADCISLTMTSVNALATLLKHYFLRTPTHPQTHTHRHEGMCAWGKK